MSLQDQLLKAGLVSKQNAKSARTQKRKARKKGEADQQEQLSQEVLKKRQEQALKDKERNKALHQAKLEQGQIKSIQVELTRSNITIPADADIGYNYTFESKVRTLYVTSALQKQLINGQAAIARIEDSVYLIPNKLAQRLQAIAPQWLAYLYDGEEQIIEEDDPYAGYEIPDDLIW